MGQTFAVLEMKTVLSYILRHYRLRSLDNRDTINLMCELMLKPEEGINLTITARERGNHNNWWLSGNNSAVCCEVNRRSSQHYKTQNFWNSIKIIKKGHNMYWITERTVSEPTFDKSFSGSCGISLSGIVHITKRVVRKISVRFEYLLNRSRGLDVTWQPVRGDLTVYPWTVTLPWG